MATDQKKIDEILGRALRDRQFRVNLVNNPQAVAQEVGLSVEEMQLISGGLAIGNSLLNPSSVMFCTAKTCNEKGGARVSDPGGLVTNPVGGLATGIAGGAVKGVT